eukprot:2229525-Pyramimonas_sp.AAC.1
MLGIWLRSLANPKIPSKPKGMLRIWLRSLANPGKSYGSGSDPWQTLGNPMDLAQILSKP